ncbi:FAD-binding monooxygenase [Methylobacterium sp. Leaf123]|uniref:FAD-dependent monooxygenase n=1 Tax=Methylobacterium sp. Leaf123 TaxID=1736264 RepID=UPI0006F3AD5D|nr:FAD-dependent monooxygenase [Methylobacterium sp. Leaf123]KQQ29405.1 FAD-binding monooxygenase [Methylobacterium sp. Leaf123]
MADVLIVGAGPVGLTLACELARFGVGVRLIDRARQATQTSKALVVWSRTLELMDRMGCTEAFLAAGLRARGATLRGGGRVLGGADFSDIASPYAFGLMIPQSDTERLLAEHLRGFGVAVEREVELTGFAQTPDGVEARLSHADGREERATAGFLIGCDGAHSAVRHGLGLPFRGTAQGDDWLLADIRTDGAGAPPGDRVALYLHRDGPFVIFPIPGGRARVVATVGRADGRPKPDPTLAEVQELVTARAGPDLRVFDPVWLSRFRIHERKVSEYGRGRVFLAGDAAHIHSPAGGQGMNTGVQDAVNLAWKLALVLRGAATPRLLDSYSSERNAVGEMVLRNAGRLTAMATLTHPLAQAIRNRALHLLLSFHPVRRRMAAMMSEIAIGYPASPLSVGPGAGRRWRPEDAAGSPPGAGADPRFVLYAADTERGTALTHRFPGLVQPIPRKNPDSGRLHLVRPDGYVGLAAGAADWDGAAHYLKECAAA